MKGVYIGFLGFFALVRAEDSNISSSLYDSRQTIPMIVIILFAFIFGLAIFLIINGIRYAVRQMQCPSCGKAFSREIVGEDVVSEKTGYKTVTRQAKDEDGNVVSEWEDQVRVKTVEYVVHFKCSNCGHEWTGNSTREYQNFDD